MYAKCREYLIDRLRASGIQMEPITSLKKLQLYRNSHVGAVLFDEEKGTVYQRRFCLR